MEACHPDNYLAFFIRLVVLYIIIIDIVINLREEQIDLLTAFDAPSL
jgi:hypothetical protein